MSTPITFADLKEQHISDIGRRIEMAAQEVDDLSELFEAEKFPEGRVDAAFRVLVPDRINEDDVDSYILHENIAPKNRSIRHATFRKTVQDYGTRHEYTAKAIQDSPDSVVADCTEDLKGWTVDMKKYLALKALKSTHSSVAYATSMLNTIDKAYSILSDVLEAEFWASGEFLSIIPGQIRQKIKNEILALNNGNTAGIAPSNEQAKMYKGYVGSYGGFAYMVPKGAAKYLQDDTNYYAFFIGKTDRGTNPLRLLKKEGKLTEINPHPLGSGFMKNADGELVPDYNNQKGGIGENMKGILYYIRDDRFVLMCTIAKSSVNAVDITAEIPADGEDDGTVVQTLDRVVTNHGGSTSGSGEVLAISGAQNNATLKNTKTIQLKANRDVIWSTSTPTLCSVSANGLVTGKATSGTAKVKAFDGTSEVEISFTCAANS